MKAVKVLPQQAEWSPFPFPAEKDQIDFTHGLLTLAGSDDPNLGEGRVARGYITEILGLDMGTTRSEPHRRPRTGQFLRLHFAGRLY
ncbi:Ff.00g063480.m01.CDS01 [Fusarium sp. VM40]|nr:Ff.00g063480.m01.CDS01 [Fusarium sp. VM40]